MSLRCLRALVAEYSAATCLDGEQSAPSNLIPTPQAYCAPDRMTAFLRPSRSGMTYAPLTEDRGEELLTLYRAGFRARTSAQQEPGPALTETAPAYGLTWRALFAKYDPLSHSLKTAQCSLLEGLPESLQTCPRWGGAVNGEYFQRAPAEHHIHEKECSLWPTPTKSQATHGFGFTSKTVGRYNARVLALADEIGWKPSAATQEALMGFPMKWTDLQPLEMHKFQQWRQQHGDFCTTD